MPALRLAVSTACLVLLIAASPERGSGQAIPGDLFVAEYAAGSVVNIRGGGDFTGAARFATGLSGPRGLCVGPGGDLYVAEFDAGEVTAITSGGDFTALFAFATGLAAPVGLLCDEDQILVVESGEGQGEVTDITAGGDFTGAPSFAAGIGDAAALFGDSTGRLFASDATGGRIMDITSGGVFLSVPPFASAGAAVGGMAEPQQDVLVAANGGTGQVLDFTAGGDLTAAPVFATLPGLVNVENVPGLGFFAASDAGDAVHDIAGGGDFTGAPAFASGVAVDGYAGITHVRGCGDGILEPADDEICDDGNLVNGDGCDDICRVRLCLTPPAPSCVAAAKASLAYSSKREGREKLKLKMSKLGEIVGQGDFGAPTFDNSRWDICLYDESEVLAAELFVDNGFQLCGPKDETCWKAIGTKGYKYKDVEARESGVRAIKAVAAPKVGKGKVQVQGSNKKNQRSLPTFIARRLEGHTAATVRLMISDGRCYGATLTDVKKNDEDTFNAKTP